MCEIYYLFIFRSHNGIQQGIATPRGSRPTAISAYSSAADNWSTNSAILHSQLIASLQSASERHEPVLAGKGDSTDATESKKMFSQKLVGLLTGDVAREMELKGLRMFSRSKLIDISIANTVGAK